MCGVPAYILEEYGYAPGYMEMPTTPSDGTGAYSGDCGVKSSYIRYQMRLTMRAPRPVVSETRFQHERLWSNVYVHWRRPQRIAGDAGSGIVADDVWRC